MSKAWPWALLAILGAVTFYWEGLTALVAGWSRPEYSYGPMVPFITLYLALQEIHRRPIAQDNGSRLWAYVAFGAALLTGLLGNLAQIPDIIGYGFIVFVGCMVLAMAGPREGLRLWPGWVHLIFMLPLPQFLYLSVSTQLQVLSSNIGVLLIQLANIPVFLDGNIIDLGIYKLQVAEACSGLRYLFPLFSFGWLVAALYSGPKWHRVVIFLSTVPITILMNSFRIGVIGVMVNYYGISAAEGFLHLFEGWIIFIACTFILCAEAWLLWHLFVPASARSGQMLVLHFQPGLFGPLRDLVKVRGNRALIIIAGLMFALGLAWQLQPAREAAIFTRTSFAEFPMAIGDWQGSTAVLEPDVVRVLSADDYLVAGYRSGSEQVSLLLTFYRSETEGSAVHSPEVCLPGGGWEVSGWTQSSVRTASGAVVPVNRAIIQRGLDRQLVYYWFEGRGRKTPNDYVAKFLSIMDTVTSGRSDGGLVRIITPIGSGENISAAEGRLGRFLDNLVPQLPGYYPAM